MKLLFKNIIIENFLSLGSAEVKLNDRGFVMVKGVNNNPNDMAKSNGSGKSSIFEAISWVLTGETIRGVKDVVNMFSEGGTKVELNFIVDNDEYLITRYKDHSKFKNNLFIIRNGEDVSGKGIRDSEKLLEQYLPDLTSKLIGSVILLGQGLPQRFSSNSPSKRKEILEELSKSDFMIMDLKERISKRQAELTTKLREVEDTILSSETRSRTLQSQIDSYNQQLSNMEDPALYDSLIAESERVVSDIQHYLEIVDKDIDKYNQQVNDLSVQKRGIESQYQDERYKAQTEVNSEVSKLEVEYTKLNGEVTQLEKEIRQAKSIKDTCPTCGQKLNGVVIPDTTDKEEQVVVLKQKLCDLTTNISNVKSTLTVRLSNINRAMDDATTEISKDIRDLTVKLNELRYSKTGSSKQINDETVKLNRYREYKSSYNAKVDMLNKGIVDNQTEIEKIAQNLVYYSESKDDIKARIEIINKFNTITKRDFRGYLLSNIIEFIDKRAKEYCRDVFETDKIDFILDGNNIDIKYCGKQYETLSGGEKQKLDLIIQFSIRDMLVSQGYSSNLLALDEIFDNLDSTGCDKVVELISRKLTDLDTIFIITHHSDISVPNDDIITVVKQENGVSYIQ